MAYFLYLGAKRLFSKNSGSVTHNFILVSDTMPSFFKKIMIHLQENFWIDGQTEGQADGQTADGQTLFYRTFSDYHLGFNGPT